MKRILAGMLALSMMVGCASPDERANRLLVEASKEIDQAHLAEKKDYSLAAKHYQRAADMLAEISDKYQTSNLAARIAQNDLKIDGHNVKDFRTAVVPLAVFRGWAEKSVLGCAAYIALNLPETEEKTNVLLSIALKVANQGDLSRTRELYELISERHFGTTSIENSEAMLNLAVLQKRLGLSDDARKSYSTASQLFLKNIPATIDPYSNLTSIARLLGTATCVVEGPERVENLLIQLPESLKDDARAGVSDWYLSEGKLKEALSSSNSLSKENQAYFYGRLVSYYQDRNQRENAIKYLKDQRRLFEEAGSFSNRWAALGFIEDCMQLGEGALANEVVEKALYKIDPSDPLGIQASDTLHNAETYAVLGKSDEYRKLLNKGLALQKQWHQYIDSPANISDIDTFPLIDAYLAASEFDKAVETAKGNNKSEYRDFTFIKIIHKLVELGRFERALPLISELRNPSSRATMLANIGQKAHDRQAKLEPAAFLRELILSTSEHARDGSATRQ